MAWQMAVARGRGTGETRGMLREFAQVDVFTTEPYVGNPVAVVLDGDGLSDAQMQRFARWTNLSETTFVLPPTRADADYRVRIFTTANELSFAGHPTLGTCHAWLEAHGAGKARDHVIQECQVGLITVRRTADGLAFAAPPMVRSGAADAETVGRAAASLGIDPSDVVAGEWVDNGPGWLALLLRDADAVLSVRPGLVERSVGVVGAYPNGNAAAIEVRAFFPYQGATVEDPVTGGLNASVAQWLLGAGLATAPYIASQGTVLGRAGRVHISTDGADNVWVGGGTITCVRGQVDL